MRAGGETRMIKKLMSIAAAGLVLPLIVSQAALAGAEGAGRGEPKVPAKTSKMQAQFDRIKKLAGDWVMKGGDGTVASSYRVSAAGSAVIETMLPGTEHEMVTVYTLDGDNLLLTHYCAAGNAPTMRATPGGPGNPIRFKFVKATNLATPAEGHMHDATLAFVDDDTIKTDWTFWENGKAAQTETFDLVRRK
jgi:hypothetical protein